MERPVMAISGTRTGIGRALAEHFVSAGYLVAGCSRGPSTLSCDGYHHVSLDVADEAAVRSWIGGVKRSFGRIDVLIANAGVVPKAMLMTTTPGSLVESTLRTNVMGCYFVCREAAKAMLPQRAGRIITISSMAVGLHSEGASIYAASKSAVVEMTKVLAKELAPIGITCNVVAPSIIMTHAVELLGPEVRARAIEHLTIKRELSIKEIGNVISFFIAPESCCVTGQVLHLGLVN